MRGFIHRRNDDVFCIFCLAGMGYDRLRIYRRALPEGIYRLYGLRNCFLCLYGYLRYWWRHMGHRHRLAVQHSGYLYLLLLNSNRCYYLFFRRRRWYIRLMCFMRIGSYRLGYDVGKRGFVFCHRCNLFLRRRLVSYRRHYIVVFFRRSRYRCRHFMHSHRWHKGILPWLVCRQYGFCHRCYRLFVLHRYRFSYRFCNGGSNCIFNFG